MEEYRLKIKNISGHKRNIDRLKAEGKRIVFTNGCFDILHIGHARYLYSAKKLADYLIVAVNSDMSVKRLNKGKDRPIVQEDQRAELVAALGCVDAVVIFDQDTPLKVIEHLMPDVLVKGGDWRENEIVGADLVKTNGGKVISLPYINGSSTTDIVEKIKGRE